MTEVVVCCFRDGLLVGSLVHYGAFGCIIQNDGAIQLLSHFTDVFDSMPRNA